MKLWQRWRAAIFDLDGTLADSMRIWDGVCREWMEARGLTPPDGLEERIRLMTLEESARYITGEFLPGLEPGCVLGEWNRLVADRYEASVLPKEGAVELVRRLRREGMAIGLATSSFPGVCERFLDRFALTGLFSAIVYTDETGRDKSHPDVYLACARRMGVPPGCCVVFEDIEEALEGVDAAGMEMVAVRDDSCKNWERLRERARWAVDSLALLLDGGDF